MMKHAVCAFEAAVMNAARLEQWTDDVRAHSSVCPVCKEALRVNRWMQTYAGNFEAHTLPSHRIIWLKAQYAHKQERLSKLEVFALAGLSVIGLGGFVGLMLWQFPRLLSAVLDVTGRSFPDLSTVLSRSASLTITVAVMIIVWVLTRDSFMPDRQQH